MIFQAQNHFSELEEAAAILRSRMALEGQLGEATMVACLGREHAITVQRTTESRGAHAFGYDAPKRTLWFRNTVPRSTRQFQMVRLIAELSFSDMLDETPQVSSLVSPLARRGAKRYLAAYIAGAVLFPYEQFLADAQALRYDVDALSERYDASFEQIAHRLVTLRRAGAAGVPFGFLRADPAGRLSKHFPLPGLLLPNSGHACPLWAIYAAFRSPGHVVRQITRFPDGSRFLFVAKAAPKRSSGFTDHAMPHSVLLITNVLYADDTVYGDGLNLSDARFDVPVGPTCRLCTRSDCGSRQEEPWSPGGEEPPATLV